MRIDDRSDQEKDSEIESRGVAMNDRDEMDDHIKKI